MNTVSGDSLIRAIPEKNALLISTVIKCIFEFLPFRDIKRCRLICRQWNTDAEPLLRKKGKILFTEDFRTSDFLEYYSDSHRLSAVPFTAFEFNTSRGNVVSDLNYFFDRCGKNIKSLELYCINIYEYNLRLAFKLRNISPWIKTLSDHVDKLTIRVHPSSTSLALNLENLTRVKSLSLFDCNVIVNSSNINRIAPSEISLTGVTFLNQSENTLTNVLVNDFVDFSKCSNIQIYNRCSSSDINFDMSKDIVDAKKVEFYQVEVLNSGLSKIKTDFLSIRTYPSEAVKMQTKELEIWDCPSINLTYLSQTIEKLKIKRSLCVREFPLPLDLPNLKCLHLAQPSMGEDGVGLSEFEIISWFKNCSNLVDVHLEGYRWNGYKHELDVAWLPRSFKRLKLTELYDIVLLGDPHPIHVDVLLLDDSWNSLAVERIMEKIKPRVLVKIVAFAGNPKRRGSEKADDFITFVRKNKQLEKIVIHTLDGLEYAGFCGKSRFLQFVGEESWCYEFNNQIANAISKDEFDTYYDINCMISAE